MILLDPDLEPASSSPVMAPIGPSRSARLASARKTRIPKASTLVHFLREAQAAVRLRGQVTVLLTTDAAIRRLNRRFRGKNKATDVLSFPTVALSHASNAKARPHRRGPVAGDPAPGAPRIQEIAGDLAISVPIARLQAQERGHSLGKEIKILI